VDQHELGRKESELKREDGKCLRCPCKLFVSSSCTCTPGAAGGGREVAFPVLFIGVSDGVPREVEATRRTAEGSRTAAL